jgi:hypothetical protein
MRGEGLKSILKSIGKVLGPIAKEIGPTVLKEFLVPLTSKMLKKKLGLEGGALRLAGQRGNGTKGGTPFNPKRKKKRGRPRKGTVNQFQQAQRKKGRGLGSVGVY